MTNIIFTLRQVDLTLLLFWEMKRFIFTQRAKYSGERFLWGRCLVDSLNLSTEPSLQYNRTNNTEKSAGFHCCFDIRFQRKNNILLNTHIIADDGMNVAFYRNNNKDQNHCLKQIQNIFFLKSSCLKI